MKKTLLFFVGCSIAVSGIAQIVRGTVGQGTYIDWEGESSTEYGLDFNNDGNLEFVLTASGFDIEVNNSYVNYVYTEGGNNIASQGSMSNYTHDVVQNFTIGSIIGPSCNWIGAGDAYLYSEYSQIPAPQIPLNTDCYLGFRIKLGSSVHYGWAKVNISGSGSLYDANWLEIYYEKTPNKALTIGSTTGIGNGDYEKQQSKIYAYNHTIRIENINNENVTVFDVMGRCCAKGNTSTDQTFYIPNTGFYIVKVGKISKKIIIQ